MDCTKNDTEFTVQRRDISVPVGCAGGQAAPPPRPSSNDREEKMEGTKGGTLTTRKGEGGKGTVNPFQRRDSLPRTPPSRARSFSEINSSFGSKEHIDLTEDSSCYKDVSTERASKKRKAIFSPKVAREVEGELDPKDILWILQKRTKELSDFFRANQNVHKEVKKMAIDLNSLVAKSIIECRYERSARLDLEEEIRELKEKLAERDTQDAQVQTQLEPLTKCSCQEKLEERVNIDKHRIETYDDLLPLIRKKWVGFKATSFTKEDPLKDNTGNSIFFADLKKENRNKETNRVFMRYPELVETEEIQYERGKYLTMERVVKYKEQGGGERIKNKRIVVMLYDTNKERQEMGKEIFLMAKKVKEMAEEFTSNDITFALPQGISGDEGRKILDVP